MNETKLTLNGVNDYFTQEAFNVLRTNIQFCGQDVKLIMITSCTMGEGKSFVSLHLAKCLSELKKRVLVIDADMRKSVMAANNANVKSPVGLSELLTGQSNLKESVYTSQYSNLHIMFSGQYPPNPVELLNSVYFDELLKIVKEMYDYVIIDTPPLGMVIDAAVIATKCDGAVFVIGNKNLKYPQACEVIAQLKKVGCNILGAILNNSGTKSKRYYYDRKRRYY